jgi:hypothetical protein
MAGTQLLPIALLTLLALSANNASAQQDTAPAAQHGPNEVLRNPVGQVNSMKMSRWSAEGAHKIDSSTDPVGRAHSISVA